MKGRGQLAVGSRVAGTPYRVARLIGSGGMGNVYEVEHEELGRLFVLKILHETLSDRTDVVARMRNEWRVLAGLRHPNIVQVTDAGHTLEGRPFYVMERLDGETVAALVARRGRLSALVAGRIVVDMLEGLVAAHAAGAIHRDIKPQNVFVVDGGAAKLLDFGIAKVRDRASEVVTVAGKTIGTPRFMAPEQAEGRLVDGRADIYSSALVFYEMLAGRGPFAHVRDPNELVLAHIGQEPERLDWITSDVNSELADLVHRWLAKRPSSRPPNAAAARDELSALLFTFSEDAPSPSADVTLGGALYDAVTVGPSRSTAVSAAEWEGPRPEARVALERASETPSGQQSATPTTRDSSHETLTHEAPGSARSSSGAQPVDAPGALAPVWNEPVPSQPFPARLSDVHGASAEFSSAHAPRAPLSSLATPPPVSTSADRWGARSGSAEAAPDAFSGAGAPARARRPRSFRWGGPGQKAFFVALAGSFVVALVCARAEWGERDDAPSGPAAEGALDGRGVIDVDAAERPSRSAADGSGTEQAKSTPLPVVVPAKSEPAASSATASIAAEPSPADPKPSGAPAPAIAGTQVASERPREKSAEKRDSMPSGRASPAASVETHTKKISKKTVASPAAVALPDSGL